MSLKRYTSGDNWNINTGWEKGDINNLYPGDYIRYTVGSYKHSIVVTDVYGDSVKVVECNYGGRCLIRWDRVIKIQDLSQPDIRHFIQNKSNEPERQQDIPAISMTLDQIKLNLSVGGSATLTPVFTPSDATETGVMWMSTNDSIATVNENGVVTAISKGTASIIATSLSCGDAVTCSVTVADASTVPVTGISLDKSTLTMTVGETTTLTATVTPANASDKNVVWSLIGSTPKPVSLAYNSNQKEVVTLSAVAPGTEKVTAILGDYRVSCDVTVVEKQQQVQEDPDGYYAKMNAFINDYRWKDGSSWPDGKAPYISSWSCTECVAYAYDFTKYMYGVDRGSTGQRYTSVNDIRTGDIVFVKDFSTSGHTFVVLERNGNTLYTAEGHWQKKARVDNAHYYIQNGNLYDNNGTLLTMDDGYHFIEVQSKPDSQPVVKDFTPFTVAEIARDQVGTVGSSKYTSQSGAWGAYFANWCYSSAGVSSSVWPGLANVTKTVQWFQNQGRWHDKVSYTWSYGGVSGGGKVDKYIPQYGDWVVIETNGDNADGPEHGGIVESVSCYDDRVSIVVGNQDNKVVKYSYKLSTGYPIDGSTASHVVGICEVDFGGHFVNGAVEVAEGGAGTLHVKGWAFDYDDETANLSVTICIGGQINTVNARETITPASKERKDINEKYGIANDHGFECYIQVPERGKQEVWVYTNDIGSKAYGGLNLGPNEPIWVTITDSATAPEPTEVPETPTPEEPTPVPENPTPVPVGPGEMLVKASISDVTSSDATVNILLSESDSISYVFVNLWKGNSYWDSEMVCYENVDVKRFTDSISFKISSLGAKLEPGTQYGVTMSIHGDLVNEMTDDLVFTTVGGQSEDPEPTPKDPEATPRLEVGADGQTHCYINGVENDFYCGLALYNDRFVYVEYGKQDFSKMGFTDYEGSKFLIVKGEIETGANGLVQDIDNKDDWYYCANGQVQNQYTGLAYYDGEWFYINRGKLNTTLTAYVSYDGGLFYVAAGRIVQEVNGLAKDPNGKDWYYLANGQAQTQYTGLAYYDGAWFYVVRGKLAENYTGQVQYDGAMFNVVNGMVK